jgi:hypothetical protein
VWTKDGALAPPVTGRAGAEAWSLRAGTGLNCVGDPGQQGHPAFWDPLRPIFSDENKFANVTEAINAGILSEGVVDRELLPVFTQRMRTGEFDPRDRQPYTKITEDAIESKAHRQLAQTVAEKTLTLLQNRRPKRAKRPLLPVDPRKVKRVAVLGDQANKVFLGQYSGNPHEAINLLEGIRKVVPRARVTFDAANTSTTATEPPEFGPETEADIKKADLVVVMVGTDVDVMTEGFDRKTISLPGNYQQLVDKVAAVGNPRIVLVDQSAGPVDLRAARRKVASILFSAANGQRQGIAAARVIFGKVNPSGHLSFTWYSGDKQLPAMSDYDLTPQKTGGLGRTYMYFTRKPAWPFGFGGSYTRFRYSQARASRRSLPAGSTLKISFRVTNSGRRAGATVAQLYATPPSVKGSTMPTKRLVGFKRTRVLRPGRSQRVTISVPLVRTLRMWNAARKRQVVYHGTWRFRVARSSRSPVRTLRVRVTGSIPRRIATVSLAPPKLALAQGETLNLRDRNPWLDGLAPTEYQSQGNTIISAVRRDDSFVDLSSTPLRFTSNRRDVLSVDGNGKITAVGRGVATVTVEVGRAKASATFVVP